MQQLKKEQFWLGDGVRISCSAVTSDEVQIQIRRGDERRKRPQPWESKLLHSVGQGDAAGSTKGLTVD